MKSSQKNVKRLVSFTADRPISSGHLCEPLIDAHSKMRNSVGGGAVRGDMQFFLSPSLPTCGYESGRADFCQRLFPAFADGVCLLTVPRFERHCGAPVSDPARFRANFKTRRVRDRRSGGSIRLRTRTAIRSATRGGGAAPAFCDGASQLRAIEAVIGPAAGRGRRIIRTSGRAGRGSRRERCPGSARCGTDAPNPRAAISRSARGSSGRKPVG